MVGVSFAFVFVLNKTQGTAPAKDTHIALLKGTRAVVLEANVAQAYILSKFEVEAWSKRVITIALYIQGMNECHANGRCPSLQSPMA